MKKRNVLALLLAVALLLSGCSEKTDGTKPMEELFEKTAASLAEGHFFFAGKVTSALAEPEMISFYEAETEKNTFYRVEITDDPFDSMPDRTVTVCVMGSAENFSSRMALEKNKEYFFDTSLWVQGDEAVFLLPTFYENMPERAGDVMYYTDQQGRALVDGSYQDYLGRLQELAEENHYGPEAVLTAAKERLASAVERDAAYFKDLAFETLDRAALTQTNQTAAALLQRANEAENNWEGIRGLLQ